MPKSNDTIFYITVIFLLIPDESDAARWVDANLRARESVQRRREMNYLERRSIDEIDMSVDELLLLTEGDFFYLCEILILMRPPGGLCSLVPLK